MSFLMDHQLELGIRALQAAQLLQQDSSFWLMQGLITADSFGHYRLELAVDLTEEEENQMVHQLAGLGDRAELPLGLEYWERDGDLVSGQHDLLPFDTELQAGGQLKY